MDCSSSVAAYQNHNNVPVAVFEAPPPVGYRFRPTDFELLDHYLRRLIHGHPLPTFYPRIIHADIYADHPSAIWNLGDAHDDTGNGAEFHCYFFTTLQSISKGISKGRSGKKMERRVGAHGTWHMSCSKDIKVNADQVLGYNKYFNYKQSKIHPEDVEYEWGMHEFTLHGSLNHALCKITRRMRKKKLEGVVDESVGCSSSDKSVILSNQQQPDVDLSPRSVVTTSSLSSEVEYSDDIFFDLEDLLELGEVMEEFYQPRLIGSTESTKQASKRARVEGTECFEYDQHIDDDEEANGVKKYRRC